MQLAWVICEICDKREPAGSQPDPARFKAAGWKFVNGYSYCADCWRIMEYTRKQQARR